jgi:hypothetical protein
MFVAWAVLCMHCCHVLSFNQGKWVVWKMLNSWCINKVGELYALCDIDVDDKNEDEDLRVRPTFAWFPVSHGNICQFVSVLHNPTGTGPPCCVPFFGLVFTQVSQEKEQAVGIGNLSTACSFSCEAVHNWFYNEIGILWLLVTETDRFILSTLGRFLLNIPYIFTRITVFFPV